MSDAGDRTRNRETGAAVRLADRGWRERLRRLGARALETAGAIGLVLVFFLLCVGLLLVVMPKGIGLGTLMRSEETAARSRPSVDTGEGAWQPVVGMLSSVRHTVKSKPSGSIVWSSASSGLKLADRDAVQTYDRSGATISFEGPSDLRVGENSTVVVRRMERDPGTGAGRASVVLAGGEMEGSISAGPSTVEVVAGAATARMMPTRRGAAEFRVEASAGESSTFTVYRGHAEVTANGRTVVLTADQAVSVDESGRLGAPVRLPSAPLPRTPPDGLVLPCRTLPAEVPFSWASSAAATGFRLVIARDPQFGDLALDKRLDSPAFLHGNLAAGRYWWKVSAVEGATEGRASEAGAFDVVLDTVAPPLTVDFPTQPVGGSVLFVRGTTEPGVKVFVGEESVVVEQSGRFEGRVSLRPGPNVVVVEALDVAGNVAYRSALVLAVE
jgi:hypothetical protein